MMIMQIGEIIRKVLEVIVFKEFGREEIRVIIGIVFDLQVIYNIRYIFVSVYVKLDKVLCYYFEVKRNKKEFYGYFVGY